MDRWPDSPALDVLPTRAYAGGLDFFRRWGDKTYSLAGSLGSTYIAGDPAALRQAQRSSRSEERRVGKERRTQRSTWQSQMTAKKRRRPRLNHTRRLVRYQL